MLLEELFGKYNQHSLYALEVSHSSRSTTTDLAPLIIKHQVQVIILRIVVKFESILCEICCSQCCCPTGCLILGCLGQCYAETVKKLVNIMRNTLECKLFRQRFFQHSICRSSQMTDHVCCRVIGLDQLLPEEFQGSHSKSVRLQYIHYRLKRKDSGGESICR